MLSGETRTGLNTKCHGNASSKDSVEGLLAIATTDHLFEMADEMDDGVAPEICDQGGLGFAPQRRHICNKLLPYADQLDEEICSQLTSIKNNLCKAVVLSDIRKGALYWTGRLHRFIKLYSYCFSKEDHVKFVHLLFELVIAERQDTWVTLRFCHTLLLLLKKLSLLTPDDLQLPWRPLYDLHRRLFHGSVAFSGMLRHPHQCETTIVSVIRHCRSYFAPGTTEEVLEEFFPRLCPFDEEMVAYMKYFDIFIPVVKRHGGAPPKHHLWRPFLLDMIRNCPYWESNILGLLARLAWKNIGTIDWEDELPLFFTKVLRAMKLPVGYKGLTSYSCRMYDTNNIAMFVVANLGGGSSAQLHLSRLVGVVESYLHPSNTGHWTPLIMDCLNKITLYFNKRFNRERRQSEDNTWDCSIPASKRLTEEDIDAFVGCLLPPALTALFGRACSGDAAMVLGRLASLRSNMVLPKFLDLLYPALTSSTEPARLQACLQAAVLMARTLSTGGTDFPAGPTHVLPVLRLLLPGLDHNDIGKTMATFQLITTFVSLTPLADCSDAPAQVEMTEVEMDLCQQSSELMDFLVEFMKRCFSLVESCVSMQATAATNTSTWQGKSSLSREECQVESGMFYSIRGILVQCHPTIAKKLIDKLVQFVLGVTLEVEVAGRLLANICRAAAKAQPELTLQGLFPPLCERLMALTAPDSAQKEERPDSETMYNLLILTEVISVDGKFLTGYVADLSSVLRPVLSMACMPARRLAVIALANALSSLTQTSCLSNRSTTHSWDSPYSEFLPVKHWGALINGGSQGMQLEWTEPGVAEKEAVSAIIHTFLVPELDKLDAAAKDLKSLSREELQYSLSVVQESLSAGPMLPIWDEEPIVLNPMSVKFDKSNLVLASEEHQVELRAPGRPANVRKAIADTVLSLTDTMLREDSDNTIAYNFIINILWCVPMLHTVKRNDFEHRWRALSILQRQLRNNLLGPHQHWHKVRHVMVQRALLQHLSRTLEKMDALAFTATHHSIMDSAFRLSTSNYSFVRRAGQRLLQNIFSQFPTSYLLLVPSIKRNLSLDPTEHHETFKGTLFILLGTKTKGLLVQREWEALKQLWPALVDARHSEKQSIVQLYANLQDSLRGVDMLALEDKISTDLLHYGRQLSGDWCVPISEEAVAHHTARVSQDNALHSATYNSLLTDLTHLCESGKLPWRYEQLCITMLGCMVRPEAPVPPAVVRVFVNGLVHDNINIRKLVTFNFTLILRNQKRKHLKVPLDPYSLSEEPCLRPQKLEDIFRPGFDRPDNKWLQYDPKFVDMTEEQYEQVPFVHPTYLGFAGWPSKLEVHAPASQQPSLHRTRDELPPGEQVVYDFFTSPEKVDKFVAFLSLEDQKPQNERFEFRRMCIFKGLARNLGPVILTLLKPHILRLASDSTEACQRSVAEMIAGIMRGAKHWLYADWKEATALTVTVLSLAFGKMNAVVVDIWYNALMRISMDRDPNTLAPILETLLHFPDFHSTSSFALQSRLFLCSAFIHQQEWRCMSVLQRIVDALLPALSHPYKAVRDRISMLLYDCFCHGTGLFYDGPCGLSISGESPNLDTFVDYVLKELGSLQEYSGGHSGEGTKRSLAVLLGGTSDKTDRPGSSEAAGLVDRHHPHLVTADGDRFGDRMSRGVEEEEDGHDVSIARRATASEPMMVEEDSREYGGEEEDKGPKGGVAQREQFPSPSFDCGSAETDERKNAFRLINTIGSFVQSISCRSHLTTPWPIYKLLGALCQLESVDIEQEVCSNCVAALCLVGNSLIRQQDIMPMLNLLKDICSYRWWRARNAALEVLQMKVFYNALTIMACPGAPELILQIVLDRLKDDRLEVRKVAALVLSSLLHTGYVQEREALKRKFLKSLRQGLKGAGKGPWPPAQVNRVHGAVLGLSAFVQSAPYTIPEDLPHILCTLADHINLPQPISGSIKDCLSSFKRTHHDNWSEHKLSFTSEQLDVLNDLLLSPSYYA